MKRKGAVMLIAAVALIGIDQWMKRWTAMHLAEWESTAFLPGFMELLHVHNDGAAWSQFSGMRWFLVALTAVLVVFLITLYVRGMVRNPVGCAGIALTVAGGLGNLIDRVRLGYVIDMFHLQFITYPVFNVADICVVCGVILLAVYYLLLYDKTDGKKESAGERRGGE